ncbi:hypothetical protein [Rhodococcus gannanensis]|uniref:Uncharacterized protein n=1 Tax=Rhodococcus gannanensis TaxID=1960308 RepID=A0ABW4P1F4_9NOCA
MSTAPSVDRFRRLARSSPWLWQTIEFRWRVYDGAERHAWIRRPGDLRVEDADGEPIQSAQTTKPFPGAMVGVRGGGWEPMPGRWPSAIDPPRDPDGLVTVVPDEVDVDYDSPFFENYHWVAMLNPVEFADPVHCRDRTGLPVDLTELAVVDHRGRRAWEALAQPTAVYDPRCDCCPLLAGGYDGENDAWIPGPPSRVRLDEETGVCVRIEQGGSLDLDVDIVRVDGTLDDALFVAPRRRLFRR